MPLRNKSRTKLITKIGFGFGHVLNDITATLWFGYGLIYMQVESGYQFILFLITRALGYIGNIESSIGVCDSVCAAGGCIF